MLKAILAAAGIPAEPSRFPDPPEIHAVYFDSITSLGPDRAPGRATQHDCTVELYAPSIPAGDEACSLILAELDARGIQYTTQGWYWLSAIQRYQEIVEFTHIEK